jgi:putative transposase
MIVIDGCSPDRRSGQKNNNHKGESSMHKHIHRLISVRRSTATFFVTACPHQRKPILTEPTVVSILVEEWRLALPRHGWMVGRYVVMPNHVHFFCKATGDSSKSLSGFMQSWKQWTSKRLGRECGLSSPVWQAGFFDHLLRSTESARQKWEYIIENPVRAGLVKHATDWPWQGEIHPLEMQLPRPKNKL